MISCIILLAIADIAVLILLDYLEKSVETRERELSLSQQLSLQNESITALSDAYAIQRKNTHDFHAHLDLLESLLVNNEKEHAIDYLHSIKERQLERMLIVNTHNPIFDALLNQKAQTAKKHKIQVHFTVNDLSTLSLDAVDLTTILSNLLDNAIEACDRCENKYIEITVLLKDTFFFSVCNTSQPVQIIDGTIASTKAEAYLHGFGLGNVKALLERYHGEYGMMYENGWFQFSAEIPLIPVS